MVKSLNVLDKNMKIHDLILLVDIRETWGSLNFCTVEVFALCEVCLS